MGGGCRVIRIGDAYCSSPINLRGMISAEGTLVYASPPEKFDVLWLGLPIDHNRTYAQCLKFPQHFDKL